MSSRRKSTTPCMVLPSDVVEQEEVEERIERTREEEAEEEGKMKEGVEEGPTAEELGEAVVVVPTPPDTGESLLGLVITILVSAMNMEGRGEKKVTVPWEANTSSYWIVWIPLHLVESRGILCR